MNADQERDPINSELMRLQLDEMTRGIIACIYKVANTLGPGFLEKVYENALAHELREQGFVVEQQRPIQVFYDGVVVGEYTADLLVERAVILELKAIKAFEDVHMAQCMNCLRATGLKICLLVNFGSAKVDTKRIVHNY